MQVHTTLNAEQEVQFRKWARDNYTPHMPIDGDWHPVVQDECVKMNTENNTVTVEELFPPVTAS